MRGKYGPSLSLVERLVGDVHDLLKDFSNVLLPDILVWRTRSPPLTGVHYPVGCRHHPSHTHRMHLLSPLLHPNEPPPPSSTTNNTQSRTHLLFYPSSTFPHNKYLAY